MVTNRFPIQEQTEDGTPTLYLPDLNEHYHSVKGALTEALHVYIDTTFRKIEKNNISILEIGFGTGLNTFLTLLESGHINKKVEYTSIELFPLSWDQVRILNYPEKIAPESSILFETIHNTPWDIATDITSYFSLLKWKTDLSQTIPDLKYDGIYFDAFAPEKQPELWDEQIFKNMYDCLLPGGILSTYCAKGEIRRRLQRTGFIVERLPGPIGGKREILRATKPTD